MADQQQVLEELAAELRGTVDALLPLVPAVSSSGMTDDTPSACFVGGDDDGTKQWGYGFRLFFDGEPAEVGQAARSLLQERGFAFRGEVATEGPVAFTAFRNGAGISVRASRTDPATGPPGPAAVVFVGDTACVAPDGTVDTRNPD